MEINDLTPAERRIWEAFPRDEGVDFREHPDEDPGTAASWGPERTLRAEVLRALLLDGPTQDGAIPGLKVTGARITGVLHLKYGDVDHPVRLRGCHFDERPDFYAARVRTLVLSDSVLPGLEASNLRVDVSLRLSCCRINGPLRLSGAQVANGVFLNDAVIGTPGSRDPDDPDAPVLLLNHASIGTDVRAKRLVTHGRFLLNATTVGGQVMLDDAELNCPDGTALHAETLSVGTDLRAMRMRATGRVNLTGARIPGQLNLALARLANPGGTALRASSCTAGEIWLRECPRIQGSVNLRRTQCDLLFVAPEVWPDEVRVDGLTYRSLGPHLPAEERLPALERDAHGYTPFAYEQLAAAYRTAGDEAAVRTVQLAKLRRHRRTLPRYARVWGLLQDGTVGYGFRPMRAAGWLLALLLTGSLAFAFHHPPPLKAGEAPDFNPVFYTLDLLLPIIGFGQEAAFAPSGAQQWLSYLLIVTGWTLATTIAAGITRALSRQ
ncbi:membrane-associated oxidoreductase [Streptomyces solicathayae]|uniref:Membrane-associated oxidoreductase n=1 Tax=Streptomyces solicathayae TaxID=3081768 RepID=A0ABZ0M0Z6_9ACTN|nr:membrane-associated oxidoreductase [Streptomyces sp. HUAS YS2]WOX25435.1 membrane-associated oxidoreductase [Streptomyces sp. HUAS YS2]